MPEKDIDRDGVSLIGSPHERCMTLGMLDSTESRRDRDKYLEVTRIHADGLLEHVEEGHDGRRMGRELQAIVPL